MSSNIIVVKTGNDKRLVAWRRNGLLGRLCLIKSHLQSMQNSNYLSASERESITDILDKVRIQITYMQLTKSSNVKKIF